MKLWRVIFGPGSAVIVKADTAEWASLSARIDLWVALGRWLNVERVEEML